MQDTDPALMTAETLLGHYARRTLSPVEALKAVTERIARHNPKLNAFAVMVPQSLAAAGESAARWRAGRPLGPLDGVPCTVKDLVPRGAARACPIRSRSPRMRRWWSG